MIDSPYMKDAAFPFVTNGGVHEHQAYSFGMTRREVFAVAALQGLLAGGEYHYSRNSSYAVQAVELADELLKQLGT